MRTRASLAQDPYLVQRDGTRYGEGDVEEEEGELGEEDADDAEGLERELQRELEEHERELLAEREYEREEDREEEDDDDEDDEVIDCYISYNLLFFRLVSCENFCIGKPVMRTFIHYTFVYLLSKLS